MCVWETFFSELVLILPLHLSHTVLFISSHFSLFFSLDQPSSSGMSFVSFLAPCSCLAAAWLARVWQCYWWIVFTAAFYTAWGTLHAGRRKMSTLFTSSAEPKLILLLIRCYYNGANFITFRPVILLWSSWCCLKSMDVVDLYWGDLVPTLKTAKHIGGWQLHKTGLRCKYQN